MTVTSDLDKKLTLGDADGPDEFIPTLGIVVPTFLSDNEELVLAHARGKFKRLRHHVPFKMRGYFRVTDWPAQYQQQVAGTVRTDIEGYVKCHGLSRGGVQCSARAVNRSHFCRNHGGALNPADKKISGMTLAPMPEDRIEKLDRVQKFMQGFIDVSELDDDEVKGQFIRNDDGVPVKTVKLGAKFQAILSKELLTRLNSFLMSETPDMLKVMVDIAKNDLFEAGDRIKAAQWVAERTMGKTADVVLTGQVQAPYASILEGVEAGSRESYRQSIRSQRVGIEEEPAYENIVDAEIEDSDVGSEDGTSGPDGSESSPLPDVGDSDGESAGVVDDVQGRVASIEEARKERIDKLKRIRKAKQRRYAARAVGATSLSDIPWLVEFLPQKDGTHRMKLIPPDKQTPAVVDKIMEQYRLMKDEANGEESNG